MITFFLSHSIVLGGTEPPVLLSFIDNVLTVIDSPIESILTQTEM